MKKYSSSESVWHNKKPFIFRPPKNNHVIVSLARFFLPFVTHMATKVEDVEIKGDGLERLREFSDKRVILTPNHPEGIEPFILFHISRVLDKEFNFLAAKEVFEQPPQVGRLLYWLGGYSWFLQRLGVYSIVRGTTDRNSFRMTRQLLVDGERWLVVFPEGEACWQSDTVMPFQHGVVQLAFWAYNDLVKRGKQNPLYFIPVSIKYIYLHDMHKVIEHSLSRLESKLSVSLSTKGLTLYERLRHVCEAVLGINEKEYNISPRKDAGLNERFQYVKELVVSRVETALGFSPRPEHPLLERIRDLFNAIDQIAYSEQETEYEKLLHQSRQQEAQRLYNDLWRVHHFAALYDGYVRETLSIERFLDVLVRLEVEVFGQKKIFGMRRAVVKIGNPLDIENYFNRYNKDKQTTIQEVTMYLEKSVKQMLGELGCQGLVVNKMQMQESSRKES
jgi:1-acyl-sn-glycerol-3-phosphate acyltransferase